MKPKWFAKGFREVPKESVYAINSGSLLKITVVQEIGGYSELFWLDASDIYLFTDLNALTSGSSSLAISAFNMTFQ